MNNFKFFMILFVQICIISNYANTQDTWTQKADFGGTARQWANGFSISDKGYIIGGDDGNISDEVWEYDPSNNTWTQKNDFPGGVRRLGVAFSIGNKGYFGLGEYDKYNSLNEDDLWEYDPSTDTWTQLGDFPGGARRIAVGFTIGNKGYAGTGYSNQSLDDFWEYDPTSDSWTQLDDFPGGARYYAVGFSINGKGYLGTGYNGSVLNDFWEYDPDTDSWTKKSDYDGSDNIEPVGFSIKCKGYIGTGSSGNKQFWEFNPSDNSWSQVADFGGVGRRGAVGFSIGNHGYIGTGYSGGYKRDFWEYTPVDECPPDAQCKNISVTLENGTASIEASDIDNGSSDESCIKSLTVEPSTFDCSNIGDNTVTLTVTDIYNNISTCEATVTIVDNTAPTPLCQNKTVQLENGTASISVSGIDNGSYDNCGISQVIVSPNIFDCNNIGENIVTLTVTDNNDNTSTCGAIVTVIGEIPIVTITVDPSITMDPGGEENTIYIGYGAQELTLTASEGTSYEWSSSPDGFFSNEQSVAVSPDETTTYTVIVSNEYGCEASESVVIYVVDVRCGNNNNDKVMICHNGHTICVADDAVEAHLNHGDYLSTCTQPKQSDRQVVSANGYILRQNKPNPFAQKTNIEYSLPEAGFVVLKVFDLYGNEFSTLVNQEQTKGTYNITFENSSVSEGFYFYRLNVNGIILTKQMIILK